MRALPTLVALIALLLLTGPRANSWADAPDPYAAETARIAAAEREAEAIPRGEAARTKAVLEPFLTRHPFHWQSPTDGPPGLSSLYRALAKVYLAERRDLSKYYLLMGQAEALDGDFAAAGKRFETGLTIAPTVDLAYGVGWSVLRQCRLVPSCSREQIESAISYFEWALRIDPAHRLSLNSLGHCHYWLAVVSRPRTRAVVSDEDDTPPLDPTVWLTHIDGALSAWERYVKHYPPSSRMYYLMGELHHSRGDRARTAHYWELALGIGSEYPKPVDIVRLYEYELNDPKYAERMLRLSAERHRYPKGAAEVERALADFWLRHGRYDEAISWFRRRAERVSSAVHFYELGCALEDAGRAAEALVWYRRAEQRHPPFIEQKIRDAIRRVCPKPPQRAEE